MRLKRTLTRSQWWELCSYAGCSDDESLLIPSAVWTLASHPNLALYIGVGGQWQVAGAIPELFCCRLQAAGNCYKQRFAFRKEAVQALSAALEVQELLEH